MTNTGGEPSLEEELEAHGLVAGSYEIQPLDTVRRTVAKRLTAAARDVPTFPLTAHVDMEPLLAARSRYNDGLAAPARASINDLVIKAAGLALAEVPEANASFTSRAIIRHKAPDISMAVAIPGGLITPIIRDVATKPLEQIAAETKDLAARAAAMQLKPEEYFGGTFCVSNLGMFSVSSFASIINPPQGAILSVGAAEDRVVAKDRQPVVVTMATMTLTCDHRVIDGATGARWLSVFKRRIETPDWLA